MTSREVLFPLTSARRRCGSGGIHQRAYSCMTPRQTTEILNIPSGLRLLTKTGRTAQLPCYLPAPQFAGHCVPGVRGSLEPYCMPIIPHHRSRASLRQIAMTTRYPSIFTSNWPKNHGSCVTCSVPPNIGGQFESETVRQRTPDHPSRSLIMQSTGGQAESSRGCYSTR